MDDRVGGGMGLVVSTATGSVTAATVPVVVAGTGDTVGFVTAGVAGTTGVAAGETPGCAVAFPAGRGPVHPAARITTRIRIPGRKQERDRFIILFWFTITGKRVALLKGAGRTRYRIRGTKQILPVFPLQCKEDKGPGTWQCRKRCSNRERGLCGRRHRCGQTKKRQRYHVPESYPVMK